MFTPTKEQEAVINHKSGHALVIAGPGSGKTTTLIQHLKALIASGEISKDDVWVMVFNRDISSSLRESIEKEFEELEKPSVSTIHGFALVHMLKYGSEFIKGQSIVEISLSGFGKDELIWKPISKRLKDVHGIVAGGKRLNVRTIENMWGEIRLAWLTGDPLSKDILKTIDYELKKISSKYELIFFDQLAIRFLEVLKANPAFKVAVKKKKFYIDEFQDLNQVEHAIVDEFIKDGTEFMVLGDDDQAINDFRMANAKYVEDFGNKHSPVVYPLARDRRCPKIILDFADSFLVGMKRYPKSAGNASHDGLLNILSFKDDGQEILGIAEIVKKYIDNFGVSDKNPQVLILSSTTGKSRGTRIKEIIDALKTAGVTEVSGDVEVDPLDNLYGICFKALLSIVVNGITSVSLAAFIYSCYPHLFGRIEEFMEKKELEGQTLNFETASKMYAEEDEEMKELLDKIDKLRSEEHFVLEELFNLIQCKDSTNLKGLIKDKFESISSDGEISENLFARKLLDELSGQSEEARKKNISRVHVTTYGKSKGLEADLVIVTGADTSQFGTADKSRRLLYVASTRAKKNLLITFAEKRTGARIFAKGRKPNPNAYRTTLIKTSYVTEPYNSSWLEDWSPV